MRSAVYSLFTTLLLLVPISAVPLMAIFGVPQFTPAVTSPLDDLLDEPETTAARRKPRTGTKTQPDDDAEIELSLEDTPNWDEAAAERPRAIRKSKAPPSAMRGKRFPEESPAEITDAAQPPMKRRRKAEPMAESEEFPIQKAGHEAVADRTLTDADADQAAGIQDLFGKSEFSTEEETPAVPGYRRQRPKPTDEVDPSADKNSGRNKRLGPPTEPLTWTKAVQRLNDLGIRNFRLEPGVDPGEYVFACSYTPSHTPHVTRRFEAEADDPLKAVAKVLVQVEEATQQRVLAAPRRTVNSADRSGRE